jgi:hypothetical protein
LSAHTDQFSTDERISTDIPFVFNIHYLFLEAVYGFIYNDLQFAGHHTVCIKYFTAKNALWLFN